MSPGQGGLGPHSNGFRGPPSGKGAWTDTPNTIDHRICESLKLGASTVKTTRSNVLISPMGGQEEG